MSTGDPSRQRAAFHRGEVQLQRSVGKAEKLAERGRRVVRSFMPDQHREFFAQLSFINIGAVDGAGRPWATIRSGSPGFVSSPTKSTLEIRSHALPGEPSDLDLSVGAKIGLVGVQLETRRRNRMNGTVIESNAGLLTVRVDQSFGNCAQYIQRRARVGSAAAAVRPEPEPELCNKLSEADIRLIEASDTLFIASRSPVLSDDPRCGLDVNHRGGPPGFVRVNSGGALVFHDYAGNNFFNTFGNILLDDRAGIQFIDFRNGDVLNMTGRAALGSGEAGSADAGETGRTLEFSPEKIIRAAGALPFKFELLEYWPNMP